MEIVSQIVGGEHAGIMVRQKAGESIELGELLVAEENGEKMILQVFDLVYGSQIETEALEWASGLQLENVSSSGFMEAELRNYVLAKIKAVVHVKNNSAHTPKTLPKFFSKLRRIESSDLGFLENPEQPLYAGKVRSGSRILEKEVLLDGMQVLPTHVLVASNTGKGKSNTIKVMLYNLLNHDYCGVLVLDPHNEYYAALKNHPKAGENLKAYSPNPERGAFTLKINYKSVKPWHFKGIVPFSEAQSETLWFYYKKFKENWMTEILDDDRDEEMASWFEKGKLKEGTLSVIQRRLELALTNKTFSAEGGETTAKDIVQALDEGKKVIVDTSRLASETELLIGSIVANELFDKAKGEKGKMKSIVIEEAPRVLREGESNVFSAIAREGRKFGVGLIAITQLASLIPREILANMNTKIILGNEMKQEREALIGSAAQDLSDDSKTIAGLDKGEAIISSVYTKLAIPVQYPKFEAFAENKENKTAKRFA